LDVELPFPFVQWLGVDDLVVVVPLTVVTELDKHQRSETRRKRTRARLALAYLRDLVDSTQSQLLETPDTDGVRYRFPSEEAPGDSPDDRILGTAKMLLDQGNRVLVLSSDLTMGIRARMVGVDLRTIPAEVKTPDQVEPLEQKVAALAREVEKLRQPQPLQVEVTATPVFPADVPTPMLRLDLPAESEFSAIPQQIELRMAYKRPGHQGSVDLAKYHAELPQYAARLVACLRSAALADAVGQAAALIELMLTNRSTSPVGHAVLELKAPNGVIFGRQHAAPEAPDPPLRPEDRMAGFELRAQLLAQMRGTDVAFPAVTGAAPAAAPRVAGDGKSAEIRMNEQLLPDRVTWGGRIWISLLPTYPDADIELPYTLYAAAGSKPASSNVEIRVEHQHQPWPMPELPTYMHTRLRLSPRKSRYEEWASSRSRS
jgi:hypothetical protein